MAPLTKQTEKQKREGEKKRKENRKKTQRRYLARGAAKMKRGIVRERTGADVRSSGSAIALDSKSRQTAGRL
jgi:hypothetical protein